MSSIPLYTLCTHVYTCVLQLLCVSAEVHYYPVRACAARGNAIGSVMHYIYFSVLQKFRTAVQLNISLTFPIKQHLFAIFAKFHACYNPLHLWVYESVKPSPVYSTASTPPTSWDSAFRYHASRYMVYYMCDIYYPVQCCYSWASTWSTSWVTSVLGLDEAVKVRLI